MDDTLSRAKACECQVKDPIVGARSLAVPGTKPARHLGNRLWRPTIGLAIVIAISVSIFMISERVEQFALYGYPGIFALSLLSSATIVLPAPGLAVVSVMGSVLNPYLVGLSAGSGDALGELTGYLAGFSGRAVIENQEQYERMARWMQRYGLWVIFALSVIPNPLFDLAGIAAGALKIPVGKFLLVCWAGKAVKNTLFALGGNAILFPLISR